MTRDITVLSTLLFLLHAPCALALEHGSIRVAWSTGIAASTAAEEYGGLMMLPGSAFAVGGGVARALGGPVWAVADVDYFRVGPGEFMGRTSNFVYPSMHRSHAVSAMAGLELAGRDQSGPVPFVSGAFGVGRVAIGEMNIYPGSRTTVIERTETRTAPAFGLGFGVRTAASPSGVRATFGVRWVRVLSEGVSLNFVPVTFGVAI